MFEPVHGSAPPMAKKDIANPMAAILSMGMMLRTVGSPEAALMVERAIRAAIVEDRVTRDLGGDYGTREVGDWIAEWIRTA
jgi:3-isopropylmalate dehydrogenase